VRKVVDTENMGPRVAELDDLSVNSEFAATSESLVETVKGKEKPIEGK
jgi:hypothetical protein